MDKLKTIIEQRSLLVSMDRPYIKRESLQDHYNKGFQAGLKYVYDIIKELEDPQCVNVVND